MFKVDVITPVYNNEHFIRKCIESAHAQEEVASIIVVEDGSKDGTLSTLRQLAAEFPKLIILTHPDGVNRGIACSRNLGIRHAKSEWIAFLDSDDYYLPGRFHVTGNKLTENETADGVYEPVVNKVISMQGAKRFEHEDSLDGKVIAIKKSIQPGQVFDAMYFGRGGVVHMNGLTIRKRLALDIGLFDENLKIVDDSVFRLKAAYKGKLIAGTDQPIAVRTIHDTNSEPNIRPYDQYMKHEVLLRYLVAWHASAKLKRTLIHRLLHHYLLYMKANSSLKRIVYLIQYVISNPSVALQYIL